LEFGGKDKTVKTFLIKKKRKDEGEGKGFKVGCKGASKNPSTQQKTSRRKGTPRSGNGQISPPREKRKSTHDTRQRSTNAPTVVGGVQKQTSKKRGNMNCLSPTTVMGKRGAGAQGALWERDDQGVSDKKGFFMFNEKKARQGNETRGAGKKKEKTLPHELSNKGTGGRKTKNPGKLRDWGVPSENKDSQPKNQNQNDHPEEHMYKGQAKPRGNCKGLESQIRKPCGGGWGNKKSQT